MNQATAYGVQIEPVKNPHQPYWRVRAVRHLAPDENRGRHNLYVDVVDQTGSRVQNARLRIAWLAFAGDESATLTPLDKPDTAMELGDGSVDLYTSQTLTAWIVGDGLPSERVTGIHTRHADERGPNGEVWNSYGHHSFYVAFERIALGDTEPPIEPPEERPEATGLEARVARLERAVAGMVAGWRA